MTRALIGYTGFVGGNLIRSAEYAALYNSKNICEIKDKQYDEIVCAGVSAVKWKANKDPEADWSSIQQLIDNIKHVRTRKFVLISTVDVYKNPIGVTEADSADDNESAYGGHRRKLERFVEEHFDDYLIVRLPALYGTGLKKNAIFDLQTNNMVQSIDPMAKFQWYDARRLEKDIAKIRDENIKMINISVEPISMLQIGERFFPGQLRKAEPNSNSAYYDMRTLHAEVLGGQKGYHFSQDQALEGIKSYLEERV